MRKIFFLILIFISLGIGLFYVYKRQEINVNSQKLQITASFYPYYFFASQIGGNKVQVTNITPAGAEPHDYEPSSGDIVQIENSKLLILNGVVEPWSESIQENLKGKNTKVLIAGQGLFTQKVTDENGVYTTDPHVWVSIRLAEKQVTTILNEMVQIDPINASYYKGNANKLLSSLNNLDQDYKKGLSSCQKKDIVTSHAAFGYLAADYRLTQIPIAGLSPDAEPSLEQLANITNFVKKNNIKYIFFESLVSPKLAETIAGETGAKTLVLDPLEGLTPDALSQGQNYLTVMQENLHNLEIALECK
jgi:zinc transport system substrate-binding protein